MKKIENNKSGSMRHPIKLLISSLDIKQHLWTSSLFN